MKTLKVTDLKDGMKFGAPVYIDGESLLVPANVPLKQKDIDRLLKWEITEVQTEGDLVHDKKTPVQDDSQIVAEILDTRSDSELVQLYNSAVEKLDTTINDLKYNKEVNQESIDKLVNNLLQAIKNRSDEMISFIILSGFRKSQLSVSSVNCMILSTIIGLNLKLPNHKLVPLATGAMIHNIGMIRIPEAIIQKKGNLSDEELKVLRTHPIHSYRIITKNLKYSEEIGLIALQHHERWDGNGYPKKLSGKDIVLPARIVSVADAFEAMVSIRPYRNSMIGYKAMRELLNDNSRRFDSEILKVFIKTMGIYPIGSIVLLNDASIGRVTSIHSDSPLRPMVKIIVDSKGKRHTDDGRLLDLLTEKDLFIAKAINPKELEEHRKK
ncbi:MAG: HD-GYP domain-containing protein [Spirochaetota bacterium]